MHCRHLLATLLLLVPATAQGGRPAPEDLLPPSTWFHARLAGLGGGRAAAEHSGLYQLLTREESRGLTERGLKEIEPLTEQALGHVRAALQRAGVAPEVLRTLLRGPLALGLGRMTLVGPAVLPSVLLVIDVAGREAQAQDALAQVRAAAARLMPGPEWRSESETFAGITLQRTGPERFGPCLVSATVDGFLLLGLNDFCVKDAIRMRQAGTTLAAQPRVARNRARLPGAPVLALDLDLGFFLGWAERFLPYEARGIGQALGIEGLDGIHFATGPAGRGDMTVLQLDLPGNEKGLFKALTSQPVSYKAAAWLPAETGLFVSTSLDAPALVAAAQDVLARLPAAWRTQIEQGFHAGLDQGLHHGLHHMLENAGLDPAALHACLAAMGSEWTLAANVPPKGGFVPEALLFADVKDGRKVEAMLLALSDKLAPNGHKTMPFKEHTLHWLELPNLPVKLAPCFVVTDGMLIASLNPQTLKKALSRGSRPEGSLATDPRFAALVKETGRTSLFVDLRVPTAVRWAHDMAQPFVEQFLGQHPELGIDGSAVPTPEALEQALEDLVLSLNVDQHGVTVTARSTLGLGAVLAAAMGSGDWLLEQLGKRRIY